VRFKVFFLGDDFDFMGPEVIFFIFLDNFRLSAVHIREVLLVLMRVVRFFIEKEFCC
jgi:hypothetical protein